jgi:hypothetical protein
MNRNEKTPACPGTGQEEHPDWCTQGGRCDVSTAVVGMHRGYIGRVNTTYGTGLTICIVRHPSDEEIDLELVGESLSEPDHETTHQHLEPEEARHLARVLLKAAEACEEALRG